MTFISGVCGHFILDNLELTVEKVLRSIVLSLSIVVPGLCHTYNKTPEMERDLQEGRNVSELSATWFWINIT